ASRRRHTISKRDWSSHVCSSDLASAKHKSKSMSPDRLSGSKQKDTVEKATQKQAKHIEKRMAQLEKIEKPQAENQFQFPHSKIYDVHNHYPIVAQDLNIIKEGRSE